ncbi:MAG: restriction endonuclease subunit S [Selenomonadaceae bacterium]|nr:restriction endonuclease subunit S [Selenomonadaceae bacterium]
MDKVRIGDICTVVSGSTPKSNIEEYWNGDIKWITPAEITDDSYVISDTERHITEKAVEKTNLTLLPVGAVLLSSRAPIGKTAIVGAEMYCNQGFKNLICSERIYNKYLYFFLTSKVDYLNALGRGATFKEISKGIVEDVEIPLPSLDEQKKIAERFEAIQQLLNKQKQALLYLDNLVKSRFVEMFGDPNDDSLSVERKSIEDVCDNIYGGGTPSKSHKEYYTGNIPWVTPKDMKALSIDDSQDHITSEAVENSTTKLIPEKSVLMVIRSGILKHTLPVAINNVEVTINQDMKAFVTSSIITPEYLLHTFKMMEESILSKVRGVTADNIEFSEFKKRKIVVPPIELQNQFSDFVAQADKSKLSIQQSIETLQTLKAKLMQDYFG